MCFCGLKPKCLVLMLFKLDESISDNQIPSWMSAKCVLVPIAKACNRAVFASARLDVDAALLVSDELCFCIFPAYIIWVLVQGCSWVRSCLEQSDRTKHIRSVQL